MTLDELVAAMERHTVQTGEYPTGLLINRVDLKCALREVVGGPLPLDILAPLDRGETVQWLGMRVEYAPPGEAFILL
jgi:hypothetical protein